MKAGCQTKSETKGIHLVCVRANVGADSGEQGRACESLQGAIATSATLAIKPRLSTLEGKMLIRATRSVGAAANPDCASPARCNAASGMSRTASATATTTRASPHAALPVSNVVFLRIPACVSPGYYAVVGTASHEYLRISIESAHRNLWTVTGSAMARHP